MACREHCFDSDTDIERDCKRLSKTVPELAAEPALMTGITIAGTGTKFPLRYNFARAAGVRFRDG